MDRLRFVPRLAAMPMPLLTIVTGVVSILLGIVLFGASLAEGHYARTALIPVIPGAIFVGLGLLARRESRRMHVMHAAALIGLLMVLLGLGMGVPKLIHYYNGTLVVKPGQVARPLAYWGQVALAVIFATFEVLCIRSFIAARRWRQQGSASMTTAA